MPGAAVFLLAAERFGEVAADARAASSAVGSSGAVEAFSGESTVLSSLRRGVAAVGDACDRAASSAELLAAECRRRAAACEAHDQAVVTWRAADAAWRRRRDRWLEARADGLDPAAVDRLWPGVQPAAPVPPPFYDDTTNRCA